MSDLVGNHIVCFFHKVAQIICIDHVKIEPPFPRHITNTAGTLKNSLV